jgi:integrase
MLSEDDFSAFVRKRREEHASNVTINKGLTTIIAISNFCKRRRIAVPDVEIKTFKLKAKSIRTIYIESITDIEKIIEAAVDWLKPIIKFAVLTGFRANNILDLKWSDISSKTITITKKNCKYEDGDIQVKMIFPELQELLDSLPRCSEYVFTRDGKHIPYNTMQKNWMRLFENIDVKYINFHGLRHTHATWLLKKTNNIKLVSDSLGHSNINITTRYAHLIKSEEAQIMQQTFAL